MELFCVADCIGMVVFPEETEVVPWAGITGIDTTVAEEASAGCGAGALTGGSGELVVLSREHTTGESMESETSRLMVIRGSGWGITSGHAQTLEDCSFVKYVVQT